MRKLWAFLFFLAIIAVCVGVYMYLFVYATGSLIVRAQVSEFQVQLHSKEYMHTLNFTCASEYCLFPDIPLFEYEVSISKDGYIPEKQKIVMQKGEQEIEVNLQIDIQLVAVEDPDFLKNNFKKELDEASEILTFSRTDGTEISFQNIFSQTSEMQVGKPGEKSFVYDFQNFSPDTTMLTSIASRNDVFLRIGKRVYIMQLEEKKVFELPFTLDVLQIKAHRSANKYYIVTDAGIFLYDLEQENAEFLYGFSDFVVLENTSMIGILSKDMQEERRNFGFPESFETLVISYDPQSKKREVLTSSKLSFISLFSDQGRIYLIEKQGDIYELKNYELASDFLSDF